MKKSSLLVQILNSAFEKEKITFSTILLKTSDPYILLIHDHSGRRSNTSAQVHDQLVIEIEEAIRCCYVELENAEDIIRFEELFIRPAALYSPRHYLVTFI